MKSVNIFSFTVFPYLLSFVELMMMAAFAFMIATVFRNTSLAIDFPYDGRELHRFVLHG